MKLDFVLNVTINEYDNQLKKDEIAGKHQRLPRNNIHSKTI
jgi:hypothetical protein